MKKNFIPLINDKEKQEILNLINEYTINLKNIHIVIDNNKYIAGIIGNVDKDIQRYFEYNRFIESIYDLTQKTKISIEKCLEAYQKVNANNYNPLTYPISEEENNAFYYLENALFREIMLWDSLAQLYNLYYDLKYNITSVHYKKVIKELANKQITEIDFNEINDYITEKYDNSNLNLDAATHDYINELRNQLTHRFSITITSFIDETKLRAMPDSIYKVSKDFNKVQKYLLQIIDLILKKINSK